jgi:hypothetical protein
LDLYNDAVVVQKGTPDEQQALRERLLTQLVDGLGAYSETTMDGVWLKLGKIDLASPVVRTEITRFISEEREANGGNAGPALEEKFKIFEKNIALADTIGKRKSLERSGISEASNSALRDLMAAQLGSKPGSAQPGSKPEKAKDTYHEDLKSLNQLLSAWKMATRQANLMADPAADPAEKAFHIQSIATAMSSLAASISDFHSKYVAGQDDAHGIQNGEYVKSINNGIALYLVGKGRIENIHFQDPDAAKAILEENIGMPIGGPDAIGEVDAEAITPQQSVSLSQLKELYGVA